MTDLDGLFEKAAKPPRGEVAKQPRDDARNPVARWRKRLQVKDYDEDILKKHVIARTHLHDAPPLATWRWQTARDIGIACFGEKIVEGNTLIRLGKALAAITRSDERVGRKFRDGKSQYFLPVPQ